MKCLGSESHSHFEKMVKDSKKKACREAQFGRNKDSYIVA